MMTLKEFITKSRNRFLAYWYKATRQNVATDRNKVLFFTFQGKFTCNPKYICRRLHQLNPAVKCVWVVFREEDRQDFPEYAETVIFNSEAYYKALYSSKVLVDNGLNFVKKPIAKKKDQYYIETMHGSLGIKRIDAASNPNRKRNKRGALCGEMADYIISNSDFENEVYKSSFWGKTPILMYGHARNDILIKGRDDYPDGNLYDKVRRFYGLPHEAKLALYAPTFAREASKEFDEFDAELLRECLSQRFGGDWYILKRLHPKDARNRKVSADGGFILDGNLYTDIQEMMVAIDFGVTDYSSWIFDYVVTGKPGMIYAPDLEEYQNSTGFYYPITAAPFPLAADNASARSIIAGFDLEKYKEDVALFLEDKGCVDDGNASGRAAEMILNLTDDRLPEIG